LSLGQAVPALVATTSSPVALAASFTLNWLKHRCTRPSLPIGDAIAIQPIATNSAMNATTRAGDGLDERDMVILLKPGSAEAIPAIGRLSTHNAVVRTSVTKLLQSRRR
jgi:hypothetical protein